MQCGRVAEAGREGGKAGVGWDHLHGAMWAGRGVDGRKGWGVGGEEEASTLHVGGWPPHRQHSIPLQIVTLITAISIIPECRHDSTIAGDHSSPGTLTHTHMAHVRPCRPHAPPTSRDLLCRPLPWFPPVLRSPLQSEWTPSLGYRVAAHEKRTRRDNFL
jgi:hypothetical protein